eukprot:1994338-Rhodomonas_salina.2
MSLVLSSSLSLTSCHATSLSRSPRLHLSPSLSISQLSHHTTLVLSNGVCMPATAQTKQTRGSGTGRVVAARGQLMAGITRTVAIQTHGSPGRLRWRRRTTSTEEGGREGGRREGSRREAEARRREEAQRGGSTRMKSSSIRAAAHIRDSALGRAHQRLGVEGGGW